MFHFSGAACFTEFSQKLKNTLCLLQAFSYFDGLASTVLRFGEYSTIFWEHLTYFISKTCEQHLKKISIVVLTLLNIPSAIGIETDWNGISFTVEDDSSGVEGAKPPGIGIDIGIGGI